LDDFSDEDLLAACLWAEARGEPEEGQKVVCNVILNRVKKRMRDTIREVILRRAQFSWTNPADRNFSKVFTAQDDDPAGWSRAKTIAQAGIAVTLPDNTRNADHYLNVEATRAARKGTLPKWAQDGIDQDKVTVGIGDHTFSNLPG
jgi:spore germination cell wall hydrolase CwlJ-like protein